MSYPFSARATAFLGLIHAEIERLGGDVTLWRTREEWQTLAGLGDMSYAHVCHEIKHDKTLCLENTVAERLNKHRWKKVSEGV